MPEPEPGTPSAWLVLVDFDGTITCRDFDFVLADDSLDPSQHQAFDALVQAYERLEIGTATYFERYLDLVGLDEDHLRARALTVDLRPGFDAFLATCRSLGARVRVVSEGLDVYVQPVLEARGYGHLALACNLAERIGAGWRVRPPDGAEPCERCLNCKGAQVRAARAEGCRVAIVGNGASDLCAAREADLVLARDGLADHCRQEGIAAEEWVDFYSAANALEQAAG